MSIIPTMTVESETDPNNRDRTILRISSRWKFAVQSEIDKRCTGALDMPGNTLANFAGPYRVGDQYVAVGEVIRL